MLGAKIAFFLSFDKFFTEYLFSDNEYRCRNNRSSATWKKAAPFI